MGADTIKGSAKLNLSAPCTRLSRVEVLCNALQPTGEQQAHRVVLNSKVVKYAKRPGTV